MQPSSIHTAAVAVLARSADPVAWELMSAESSFALARRVAAGSLDVSALRAAVGIGRRSEETTAPRSVAVLHLTGVLTPGESFFSMLGAGTSLTAFRRSLASAVRDRDVKSIAVITDSPGGFIGGVPETAAAMRAARAVKPVNAIVTGLSASAAYWVTSNASGIMATPSASVGAIGVYTVRASIARALDRDGIDVETFAAGRFKSEGLPHTAITAAERTATQGRVDDAYADFVSDISAGRGVSASAVRGGYGEGRVVSAKEALRLGMIDGIATPDEALARVIGGVSAVAFAHRVDADELDRLRRLERF